MRQLIVLSSFLLTNFYAFGQAACKCEHLCDCEVSGKVFDLETKDPLPFANIQMKDSSAGISADDQGKFVFRNICQCHIDLVISYIGYQPKTVEVHADHPDFLKIYLAPNTKMLESIIVRGTADEEMSTQVKGNVAENKIESMSGEALGQMLDDISGVGMVQTGGNVVKPTIHGLNSNRIVILNNGVKSEDQQWGAEHAPAIDPLLAQHIEVIKGAASVKYGAGALGGVVRVEPPELPKTRGLSGKINLAAQSNGREIATSGSLENVLPMDSTIAWRLQGTFRRGGDLQTPSYLLTNTGIKEFNFSGAVGKHARNADYNLFVSHFDTDLGILKATGLSENVLDLINDIEKVNSGEAPSGTKSFSYDIDNPRQKVRHDFFKLGAKWMLNANVLELNYGFQHDRRQEFDIRRGNLNDLASLDLVLNTHSLDAGYQINNFKNHTVNVGVNYAYQVNRNVYGTQTLPFIPNYVSNTSGLYAIDQWKLKKATVEGGLRADYQYMDIAGRDFENEIYTSQLDFLSFSGDLGMRYPLSEEQVLSVNFSSGWRPPHVSELYSSGKHQSAAAVEYGLLLGEGNEILDANDHDVKSENSIKATVGLEHHSERFHVDASGYYQLIYNYYYLKPIGITNTVTGPFPAFHYRQTNALFTGVDVDVKYDLSTLFSVTGQYSYLFAKDQLNDDYFLYIPPSKINAVFSFHRDNLGGLSHFEVYARGEYVFKQNNAPKYIDPEVLNEEEVEFTSGDKNFDFIPAPEGYFLLDAGINFSKKWEQDMLEWQLSSTNLLNNKYQSYTNRLKYYAYEMGRNVRLAIIYHF